MFELKNNEDNYYYFALKAKNGQTILSSETFHPRIAGAKIGIETVKKNAVKDTRYERKTDKSGKFFFYLKSQNGEILASSGTFTSESGMENGIRAVKENAPFASIKDSQL